MLSIDMASDDACCCRICADNLSKEAETLPGEGDPVLSFWDDVSGIGRRGSVSV